MDLSSFIVAVFCLIDDRIANLGRLRGREPAPHALRLRSPHYRGCRRVLVIDEDTELFTYVRRHYAHFFPNLRRVIAPLSPGKQRTCGRPRSSSGKSSSPAAFLTTRSSPSVTRCPCQLTSSPEPIAASASKGRLLSARTPSSRRPSTAFGCT